MTKETSQSFSAPISSRAGRAIRPAFAGRTAGAVKRRGPRRAAQPAAVCAAALLVLFAGAAARADPVSWSYTWVSTPVSFAADVGPSGKPGTASIFLLDPQPNQVAIGPAHIVGTQPGLLTSADPPTPDRFTDRAYTMNITLTDSASGAKGLVAFTGLLNGMVSTAGASISNTYTGATTKVLTLGGHTFTVAFDSFTPPTRTTNGAFGADVTVSDAPLPPPPPPVGPPSAQTPEPSALVLAGLGLTVVGAARARKGRRRDGDDAPRPGEGP